MGGIEDMEETLKRLGFAAAEETALGAELVSREYERMVREGKQSVIISSSVSYTHLPRWRSIAADWLAWR